VGVLWGTAVSMLLIRQGAEHAWYSVYLLYWYNVQILTLRTRIRAANVFVTPVIAASMLLVYEALN
jgi:hypothetical protein